MLQQSISAAHASIIQMAEYHLQVNLSIFIHTAYNNTVTLTCLACYSVGCDHYSQGLLACQIKLLTDTIIPSSYVHIANQL